MEIKTKITLDKLTEESVSVLKQNFITIGKTEYQVGKNIRNAYCNNEIDRELLRLNVPEEYYNAILNVWNNQTEE